jgi:hypothetical protein
MGSMSLHWIKLSQTLEANDRVMRGFTRAWQAAPAN